MMPSKTTMSSYRANLAKLSLCFAVQAGTSLLSPAAWAAEPGYELTSLKSLTPYVSKWQAEIRKKSVEGAKAAAEKYEAKWQGVEVYVNHRSLPLYRDMEVDTQFAIEAELDTENPDFKLLNQQIAHLGQDLKAAIQMAKAGPQLSPLFDDLVPLRDLRGRTLLVIRDELGASTPDTAKVTAAFQEFKAGFLAVADLIEFRSAEALADINTALAAADAVFSDPGATVAQMSAANVDLINSYGFGVNLLNAAARTANLTKTAITDTDKKYLTQLNNISLALASTSPQAGATGPLSDFAAIQTALEGLGRYINAVGTLRTALVAYEKAVQTTPANGVEKARKTAIQAAAITQQALVGQFWGAPELQAFLASLPKS